MQRVFSHFTISDYAKYPFLKAASKHVRKSDLKIEELTDPQYALILKRAEERLTDAILYTKVKQNSKIDATIEIMSFPAAIMLALATQDSFIKKRYALAEANGAYENLINEASRKKILDFAQNFGWKLVPTVDAQSMPYKFSIHFADYLRNSTHLREGKWKLVNRLFSEGVVYLGKEETARLLKEEVQRYIEKLLETKDVPKFPDTIKAMAKRIKKLASEKIGKAEMEGFPRMIIQPAFPPCINALYEAFTSGKHLSHIGRFTLTSFLINVGMPSEKVIELFRNISDFNEKMTRYQVEHIAGEKGSRTKYTPPRCDTLKTHGVCVNPDENCRRVRHPLTYYRRKLKNIQVKAPKKAGVKE
ncbi:MAG: DNA primase large subunit PriL [Candidatus Bathyarchaeia archaeon]